VVDAFLDYLESPEADEVFADPGDDGVREEVFDPSRI